MKSILLTLSLLLLAACSGTPSGTYAAIGKDGQVAKQADGTPQMTLALDDAQAVLRMNRSEPMLLDSKFADGSVFLSGGSLGTLVLKVDGDLLVGGGQPGTGRWDSITFKKL